MILHFIFLRMIYNRGINYDLIYGASVRFDFFHFFFQILLLNLDICNTWMCSAGSMRIISKLNRKSDFNSILFFVHQFDRSLFSLPTKNEKPKKKQLNGMRPCICALCKFGSRVVYVCYWQKCNIRYYYMNIIRRCVLVCVYVCMSILIFVFHFIFCFCVY